MREVNKKMSIRQRVLQICEVYKISPNKLSEDAGFRRNLISRMSDNVSLDFILYIYCNFELISIEWLLTGNGSMFVSNAKGDKSSSMIIKMLDRELDKNLKLEKEIANLKEKLRKISAIPKV